MKIPFLKIIFLFISSISFAQSNKSGDAFCLALAKNSYDLDLGVSGITARYSDKTSIICPKNQGSENNNSNGLITSLAMTTYKKAPKVHPRKVILKIKEPFTQSVILYRNEINRLQGNTLQDKIRTLDQDRFFSQW